MTTKAVQGGEPLLIGLVGPSSGGKTYSALRLAKGIVSVTGGRISVIDTETRRAKAYAKYFDYDHTELEAPFSPYDYLDVINHCIDDGAKCIVIDSASHEHEGIGGVLEMQEAELERLSKGNYERAKQMKFLSWAAPKSARKKLIQRIMQANVHVIMCFRAKKGIDTSGKTRPENIGWTPIGGSEWIYEFTCKFLLEPSCDGVFSMPVGKLGDKESIKIPRQFRELFAKPEQLSEKHGEAMAKWAAGEAPPEKDLAVPALLSCIQAATTLEAIEKLKEDAGQLQSDKALTKEGGAELRKAFAARIATLKAEAKETAPASPNEADPGDDGLAAHLDGEREPGMEG